MSIISSLKDIDQAIAELNYRSETTLKYKLIHAIRNWYTSEGSLEALQAIDPEDLVKSIWETGDNPELVRNKKKNFSSIKSGVNTDLKKLYTRGKNPQGIIINHSNVSRNIANAHLPIPSRLPPGVWPVAATNKLTTDMAYTTKIENSMVRGSRFIGLHD